MIANSWDHVLWYFSPRTITDTGTKSFPYEAALREATVVTYREVASSSTRLPLAACSTRDATEDITGSVVEIDSDGAERKLQLQDESVVNSLFDTRRKIEGVLANLDVMRKAEIDLIVEIRMAKLTDSLQSHIIKAAESSFLECVLVKFFQFK